MIQEKILGQSQPGTSATALYTLPASTTAVARTIWICNTGASAETFRIFVDPTGTTYTAAKAIFYDVPLDPNETKQIGCFLPLNTAGGSIGVRASSSNVTFTAGGAEIT